MKRLMAITVISLTIFGCKKENKNSTPPTAGPDPAPVVVDSSKIYDKIDTFKGSVNGHYENYAAGYIHKDTTYGCTFIIKYKGAHIDIGAEISTVSNITALSPVYKNESIDMGFAINQTGHYTGTIGVKYQNYTYTFSGADSFYFCKSTYALCGDVYESVSFGGKK